MSAYAGGHFTEVSTRPEVADYLQRFGGPKPHHGKFRVGGGPVERLEGNWQGELIVIVFSDFQRACDWYGSSASQPLLPLRTKISTAEVFLIERVGDDHCATGVLTNVRVR